MTGLVRLGRRRRRKITGEQEDHLVQLHADGKLEEARAICAKLGVSPKYAANAAVARGIKHPRWRRGNRYQDNHVDKSTRTHNDPRWARAIALGAVVI